MKHVRTLVYWIGFRPSEGSIFYSAWLHYKKLGEECYGAWLKGIEAGTKAVSESQRAGVTLDD